MTAPSLRRRLAAAGLDYLVIVGWIAIVTALGVAARSLVPDLTRRLFGDPLTGELTGFLGLTLR